VVVDDFDILCVTFLPAEAYPPLIVDANAVLSRPIPRQLLEAIPGWHPEVFKRFRGVEQHQLAERDAPHVRSELSDRFASKQPLRGAAPDALILAIEGQDAQEPDRFLLVVADFFTAPWSRIIR